MFLSLIKSGIGYKEPTRFRAEYSSHIEGSTNIGKLIQINPTDHSQKGAITTVSESEENAPSDYWSSQELHNHALKMLETFPK